METFIPIRLALTSSRDGEWHVTSNGTYLVGFSGPHAHELAVQRHQELARLLNHEGAPETRDDRVLMGDEADD